MLVLRDVAFEGSRFQCVLHTLTLVRGETARKDDCENPQNSMHGDHKPDSVNMLKVELKEKSFCQIFWIKSHVNNNIREQTPHASYLVLVQLAVLVFLLSLFLKSDDDEAHKDVHHEESNDDDVDDKEYGDSHTIIVQRACVHCIRVYGPIEDPVENE